MLLKHKSGTALSSAGSWDILHSRSCPCFSQLTVTQFICTALMDVTTLLEQINISILSPEAVLACKSLPHLSSVWRNPHTPILQQWLQFLLSTEGVSLGWDNQGHPVHPNEEFSSTPTHPSTSGQLLATSNLTSPTHEWKIRITTTQERFLQEEGWIIPQ